MRPAAAIVAAARQVARNSSGLRKILSAASTSTSACASRVAASAAAAATAGPESRRAGSSTISASRPHSRSCSATMKRKSAFVITIGRPNSAGSETRSITCWNVERGPISGTNCLGMLSRETGQSRVPAPPHISTGIIGESIGAIWQKSFNESGIIALSPSIFHNGQMTKILYLVTEDWFFASHFLPMARAARDAGFEVIVATRVRDHADRLMAEGLRVIPLESERKSLGALDGLRSIVRTYRIVRAERPDIVHCIALRPIVVGGLAGRAAGAGALVLAPTGLGQLWIERGLAVRLLRSIARLAIASLRGPRTRFLFENRDDPREFHLDPTGPEVTIVGGAGVDPKDFPAQPEPPAPPVKVAVVSRMIAAKGIADAVEATRRARSLGVPVELSLFGAPDPSNRDSIAEATLLQWSAEPGITWHGRT